MNLFNLFKNKKNKFLVLDFGNSAVKGLFCCRDKKQVIVKKAAIAEIEEFGVFTAKNFSLDVIKQALQKTLQDLGVGDKEKERLPVIISFPTDILYAKVVTVALRRENEERCIDKAEKKKIYQMIGQRASQQLFKTIEQNPDSYPSDFQILKEKILEKNIAGYRVPSVLGFRGKDLSFKILLVYSRSQKLKAIESMLAGSKIKKYFIFHQVEGLISLLRHSRIESKVFLDIGDHFSKLFIFNRTLENTSQFSGGGKQFSRALQKKFGLTEQGAETLKISFSQGKLSGAAKQRIEASFEPVFMTWLSRFQENLERESKRMPFLSNKISLFGGGSLLAKTEEKINTLDGWQTERLAFEKLPLKIKTKQKLSLRHLPSILLAFCKYD